MAAEPAAEPAAVADHSTPRDIFESINQSKDLIVTIYDHTSHNLRYISDNILGVCGYSPQELIGKTKYPLQNAKFHHRKHKSDGVLEMEEILLTALPDGDILSMERVLWAKDCHSRTSETNVTPMLIIDSRGNILWSSPLMEQIFGPDPHHRNLPEYCETLEEFSVMMDQILTTNTELVRYPLNIKCPNGKVKSAEVDSITAYLSDGGFLHTTLFFFEPHCCTTPSHSPNKGNYFSPFSPLPPHVTTEFLSPPPPPSSPVPKFDSNLANISLSDPKDEMKRSSAPRLKVASLETQFLAQMSHDIRTPISGIIGMTSLLQTTSLTSEQKEFVDTIESSSSLLLALLNDILDLSKIEAGKVELEYIPFSLPKIVVDCVKILSVEASKRDIPITINSDPPFSDAMSEYMGDPNRIKQILMNFLSNAVKFTSKGHIEVNVRISPLLKRKESPNGSGAGFDWQDIDEIRIEVKDTGIGISDTSKLFAPFVQAALSTSRMYGGTGLGLSICKQLADIMGGQVGVKSTPGVGTTIWVILRLDRYKDQVIIQRDSSILHSSSSHSDGPTDLSQLPANWRSTCSILVAEDNIVNRKLLLHMLKRLGFQQIEMAENGKEAVDFVAKSFKSHHRSQQGTSPRHSQSQTQSQSQRSQSQSQTQSQSPRSYSQTQSQTQTLSPKSHCQTQSQTQTLSPYAYSHFQTQSQSPFQSQSPLRYDLILMDCQMPELDGYDATRIIREMESEISKWETLSPAASSGSPLASTAAHSPRHSSLRKVNHIPIVALTANAAESDRQLCLSSGMDDFCTKPLTIEKLDDIVSKWISISWSTHSR